MPRKNNTLFVLFFLPAVLVLTEIHYLKAVGIIFGICYLPGFILFSLIRRDDLVIEDLVLAFPASIGISSLSTLCLLYLGVHVGHIAYIIYGIAGSLLLFHIVAFRKLPSSTITLSKGEIRFMGAALLLTLIFSIPVISERIAISAHGFHHLSIVTEIFNGFFPPENPGMGGTSISYHWGYHALVAVLSFPADIHPLRVFSILNITALFFIFCISYRSAKSFGFSEGYCYLVPLALIGLMRADAGIFYFQKLLSGNFPPVKEIASAPLNLLTSWVWGVSYLDTRLFFMSKFYNANNMPLGICLIFSFFLILLLMLEERVKKMRGEIYTTILAVVLVALAVTYSFFLIIPLLFVPVWASVLFLTNKGSYSDKFKESFKLILPCVIAAVIAGPYLFVILSGESVITAGKSAGEIRFIYLNVQVIKNLIVFLLPSPLIIAGVWFAFKRFSFSRRLYFLLSGTLICLLLSIFLRFIWYNSAKFSFILSFFFSFMFIFSVHHIVSLFTVRWLRRAVVIFFTLFLIAVPVITETAYILSPWFNDSTYKFSGRHVLFDQERSRNEAYSWIRDYTPSDSILMLPYAVTPFWDRTAHLINYRPVALSERSLFVIKDVYTFIFSEYEERVRIREQFFEDPGNPEVIQYLSSLNRPVYLIVEEGYEDPLMEGVDFDQVPEKSDRELKLVFQNDRQRVYLVQNNN